MHDNILLSALFSFPLLLLCVCFENTTEALVCQAHKHDNNTFAVSRIMQLEGTLCSVKCRIYYTDSTLQFLVHEKLPSLQITSHRFQQTCDYT